MPVKRPRRASSGRVSRRAFVCVSGFFICTSLLVGKIALAAGQLLVVQVSDPSRDTRSVRILGLWRLTASFALVGWILLMFNQSCNTAVSMQTRSLLHAAAVVVTQRSSLAAVRSACFSSLMARDSNTVHAQSVGHKLVVSKLILDIL